MKICGKFHHILRRWPTHYILVTFGRNLGGNVSLQAYIVVERNKPMNKMLDCVIVSSNIIAYATMSANYPHASVCTEYTIVSNYFSLGKFINVHRYFPHGKFISSKVKNLIY